MRVSPRRYGSTMTGVPPLTLLYIATTSGFDMRTQPWLTACPSTSVFWVPWNPTCHPCACAKPIQRRPSGLLGPGAMRPRSRLLGLLKSKARKSGFSTISLIWKRPVGVGNCGRPIATGKDTGGAPDGSSITYTRRSLSLSTRYGSFFWAFWAGDVARGLTPQPTDPAARSAITGGNVRAGGLWGGRGAPREWAVSG